VNVIKLFGMDGTKEMNLNNYKGIYFEEETEKYFCPKTGAHFRFEDICNLLERIRLARAELESAKTIPKRELAKTYYAPAVISGQLR
jgi:hypothetical protein